MRRLLRACTGGWSRGGRVARAAGAAAERPACAAGLGGASGPGVARGRAVLVGARATAASPRCMMALCHHAVLSFDPGRELSAATKPQNHKTTNQAIKRTAEFSATIPRPCPCPAQINYLQLPALRRVHKITIGPNNRVFVSMQGKEGVVIYDDLARKTLVTAPRWA